MHFGREYCTQYKAFTLSIHMKFWNRPSLNFLVVTSVAIKNKLSQRNAWTLSSVICRDQCPWLKGHRGMLVDLVRCFSNPNYLREEAVGLAFFVLRMSSAWGDAVGLCRARGPSARGQMQIRIVIDRHSLPCFILFGFTVNYLRNFHLDSS